MVYMKIDNGGTSVPVPVQEAVRFSNERQQEMAQSMINDIRKDAYNILKRLPDIDAIEQRFCTSGDTMIKAIVSRAWDGPGLRVELYVCRIERSAAFEL